MKLTMFQIEALTNKVVEDINATKPTPELLNSEVTEINRIINSRNELITKYKEVNKEVENFNNSIRTLTNAGYSHNLFINSSSKLKDPEEFDSMFEDLKKDLIRYKINASKVNASKIKQEIIVGGIFGTQAELDLFLQRLVEKFS